MAAAEPIAQVVRNLELALAEVPGSRALYLAYSGGMDSHVLLHVVARNRERLPIPIQALHVDHRLQPDSGRWAEHCAGVCHALDVPYECLVLTGSAGPGESPEAWARNMRYRILGARVGLHGALVTAHHREDQAETFLLNAIRGSGPHGLAGMPAAREMGTGWLFRPMLGLSRRQLEEYARAHNLQWVDDVSNADMRFDRNFIRHQVLPVLETRWPGVAKTLARAASLQQQAAGRSDRLADRILAGGHARAGRSLPLAVLDGLAIEIERLVLRRWIKLAGFPVPDYTRTLEIQAGAVRARRDSAACVRWNGVELRRYRDALYIMPELAPVAVEFVARWQPGSRLTLPWGELDAALVVDRGLSMASVEGKEVTVRLRRGGERCHPSGRARSQTLKHLFQDWGIPPWERARMPLVFVGDDLAAVGSICVSQPYAAVAGEAAWQVKWAPRSAADFS